MTAEESLASGDLKGALASLQAGVRERPADAKLRVFLFQLLCVLGQWQRALTQLQVCGELDAGTLAMVNTYREAIKCELVREAVFAGTTTPMVFGEPQAWLATLVEAMQADARGEAPLAMQLRSDAFGAAPATPGELDGAPFEWIADADSRLGPVIEAVVNGRYAWIPFTALAKIAVEKPIDLRDLVWAPAHLHFVNGGDAVALLPSRYCGTTSTEGAELLLARRTEWLEIGSEQYRGLGQRVIATSTAEHGLLEVREITLRSSVEPS